MSAIQSVGGFFYSQFFKHPAVPTKDCSGKTVIVTGSNVGLGRHARFTMTVTVLTKL